jgi:hypothetical protein
LLLNWIVSEAEPSMAIEKPSFQMILRCLRPKVPLLLAKSLRRDLDFAYEHKFMCDLLHRAPGKVSPMAGPHPTRRHFLPFYRPLD